jgi:hypothetical protein
MAVPAMFCRAANGGGVDARLYSRLNIGLFVARSNPANRKISSAKAHREQDPVLVK